MNYILRRNHIFRPDTDVSYEFPGDSAAIKFARLNNFDRVGYFKKGDNTQTEVWTNRPVRRFLIKVALVIIVLLVIYGLLVR